MKLSTQQSTWQTIGLLVGGLLLAVFIVGLAVFAYFAKDLPNPQTVGERLVAESTRIYDNSGETTLFNIHGDVKRTVIPFEKIPDTVKQATIAIEDDEFYNHVGIDIKGVLRAVLVNLRLGSLEQGGSTITQQFIKNSILTPERTIARKIREWILAIELERRYSKDDILGFYLNQIPYGSNAYGIEAAAQTYFDKHATDLSLAESALLAALPKAPTYYLNHKDKLNNRKNTTLDRMAALGYITQEEADEAKQEEVAVDIQSTNIQAPHFVMFVREYLEEEYGRDVVERGGLRVITTLDTHIQTIAEEAVAAGAKRNEQRFGGENAAAVVVDPLNGKVRAMVGSRDFFDDEIDGNVNVTTSPQQPGSAFKPFAYAHAFEKGYTPETVLFDLKTNFGVHGANEYIPQNYTGRFEGPVSMREALAQSINIVAVKTLYLAGVNETIDFAERLGISTLTDRGRYGLSLVLGGGDVTPLEITNAYAAFANDGVFHPYAFIERIEDQNGTVLEEFQKDSRRVLDAQIARLVSDVLSDNDARTPVFGARSPLYLSSRPVAAKTGSTQEFRDAWTIGYTPQLVVGVWVGNNDNTKMVNAPGSSAAGPIWNEIMRRSLEGVPAQSFPKPNPLPETTTPMLNGSPVGERVVLFDTLTDEPATDETPPHRIVERSVREAHTILYYVNKDNPQSDDPPSRSDAQFTAWEQPVQQWAAQPINKDRYNLTNTPHTGQTPPFTPTINLRVDQPSWGERVTGPSIPVAATVQATLSVQSVEFFWDGTLVATDQTRPFKATVTPPSHTTGSDHVITVRAFDVAQNQATTTVPVVTPNNSSGSYTASLDQQETAPTPRFRVSVADNNGSPFTLQAERVVLYRQSDESGAQRIAEQTPSDPHAEWVLTWDNPTAGSHVLYAVVTTLSGNHITTNTLQLDL